MSLCLCAMSKVRLDRFAYKYAQELGVKFRSESLPCEVDERVIAIFKSNYLETKKFESKIAEIYNDKREELATLLFKKYVTYIFQELYTPEFYCKTVHFPPRNVHVMTPSISDDMNELLICNRPAPLIAWNGALEEYSQSIKNPADIYNFVDQLFNLDNHDIEKIRSHWNSCIAHFIKDGIVSLGLIKVMSESFTGLFTRNKFALNFKSVFGSKYFTGYREDLIVYCKKVTDQCKKTPSKFTDPHLEYCISHLGDKCYLFKIILPVSKKVGNNYVYKFNDIVSREPKCAVLPMHFSGLNIAYCTGPDIEKEYQNAFQDNFNFTFKPVDNHCGPFIKIIETAETSGMKDTSNLFGDQKKSKSKKKSEQNDTPLPSKEPSFIESNNRVPEKSEEPKKAKDSKCQNNSQDLANDLNPINKLNEKVGQVNVSYKVRDIGTPPNHKFRTIVNVRSSSKSSSAIGEASNKKAAKRLAAKNYLDGNLYVPERRERKKTAAKAEILIEEKSKGQKTDQPMPEEIQPLQIRENTPLQMQETKEKINNTANPILNKVEVENSNSVLEHASPIVLPEVDKKKFTFRRNKGSPKKINAKKIEIPGGTSISEESSVGTRNQLSVVSTQPSSADKKTKPDELEKNKESNGFHNIKDRWSQFFPFSIPKHIPKFPIIPEMKYEVIKIAKLANKNPPYKDIPYEPTIRKVLVQALNEHAVVFVIHEEGEEDIQELDRLRKNIREISQKKFNLENELERKRTEGKGFVFIKKEAPISLSSSMPQELIRLESENSNSLSKILNLSFDPFETLPGKLIPNGCIEIDMLIEHMKTDADYIRINPSSKVTSYKIKHIGGEETKREIAQAKQIKENLLAEIERLDNKLNELTS